MVSLQLKRDFARKTHQMGVFKDITKSPGGKGFRLKKHEKQPDAPLSPFYLDYRLLQSDCDAKSMAARMFDQMIHGFFTSPDRLAAIPEAIVPVVSTLSDLTRIPMVTPRTTKGHGSGSKVDGLWEAGMTAILIDDVVTGADSKIEAQTTMQVAKFDVSIVMVLTDRQQGGEKQLQAAGLQLVSAFTLDELLTIYREERLITSEVFDQIASYRAAEAA